MLATVTAVLLGCGGCTTSRNTAANRNYQAFITRYNVHYNGDKHYRETLDDMQRTYADDFSRMLFVHPAQARGIEGVPQPVGDFTRSIDKATKAIQLHSIKKRPAGPSATPQQREWKRRTEYNPFLHNSWLMLGRAQYMNGDFTSAANVFLYISRHFKWMPEVVAEARAWEALCYCALSRLHEAETILAKIPADLTDVPAIKPVYLMAKSSLLLRQSRYSEAAPLLSRLASLSHGRQKTRILFLLGQALRRSGDCEAAYEVFSKIHKTLTADFATRFNARMAMSETTPRDRAADEIRALEKLTHYSSNTDYLDQIYYALGNLQLSMADSTAAEKAYALAVDRSTRKAFDQAKARIALSGIYFGRRRYDLAQAAIAEALPMLPPDYPAIDSILKCAEVLDHLAPLTREIILHDSLLTLSRLTPQQRQLVAERLARSYKTASSNQETSLTQATVTLSQAIAANESQSWYFYNPALVKSGREQFRKIWGDRPLTDNWRISALNSTVSISPATAVTPDDTGEMTSSDTIRLLPDDPAYYLSAIPDTPERISQSEKIIEDALYNSALILRDHLDDYTSAAELFQNLIDRFPQSHYRQEADENLFLIYSRMGRHDLANTISTSESLSRKKEALDQLNTLFTRAYQAYTSDDNATLHNLVDRFNTRWRFEASTDLASHLLYLDALAYAAQGDSTHFRAGMKDIAENFPETDLAAIASRTLSLLGAGRTLVTTSANLHPSPVANTHNATETNPDTVAAEPLFTMAPDDRHTLLLIYHPDSVSINSLLFNVARHNFSTYSVRDFDLRPITIADYTALAVTGFTSPADAQRYLSALSGSTTVTQFHLLRPIIITDHDLNVLLRGRATIDDYIDFSEARSFRDAQTQILSPDIYEIIPLSPDTQ